MWSSSLIAPIVLVLLLQSPPTCSGQLRNVRLDLVVIIQGDMFRVEQQLKNVRKTLFHLPDYFELGEDKTRLHLVACPLPDTCTFKNGSSVDFEEFKTILNSLTADWNRNGGKLTAQLPSVLKIVREKVPKKKNVPQVVFLVSQGIFDGVTENAVDEARLLRENGTWIYMVTNSHTHEKSWNASLEIVGGDDNRRLGTLFDTFREEGSFPVEFLKQIKDDVDKSLCVYIETCAYTSNDRSQCSGQWWNPMVEDEWGNCNTIVPPPAAAPTIACQVSDCDQMCIDLCNDTVPIDCEEKPCNMVKKGTCRRGFLETCLKDEQCPCLTTTMPTTSAATTTATTSTSITTMGTTMSTVSSTTIATTAAPTTTIKTTTSSIPTTTIATTTTPTTTMGTTTSSTPTTTIATTAGPTTTMETTPTTTVTTSTMPPPVVTTTTTNPVHTKPVTRRRLKASSVPTSSAESETMETVTEASVAKPWQIGLLIVGIAIVIFIVAVIVICVITAHKPFASLDKTEGRYAKFPRAESTRSKSSVKKKKK